MIPPIIVHTCDAYEDLWPPFLLHLENYWHNPHQKLVFNSDLKQPTSSIFNILPQPPHSAAHCDRLGWGQRLLRSLVLFDDELCIQLFDDFFLENHVDMSKVSQLTEYMRSDQSIACIFITKPDVDSFYQHNAHKLLEIPPYTNYRLNSAPAIWRKKALASFTHPSDTPWSWEFFGSLRADFSTYKFLSTEYDIYQYSNLTGGAVHRGRWVKEVTDKTTLLFDYNFDFAQRPLEPESCFNEPPSFLQRINFYLLGFKLNKLDAFRILIRRLRSKIAL